MRQYPPLPPKCHARRHGPARAQAKARQPPGPRLQLAIALASIMRRAGGGIGVADPADLAAVHGHVSTLSGRTGAVKNHSPTNKKFCSHSDAAV